MVRINESGKDPGFGQSILHENQLVFHTPPYNVIDMTIHDQPPPIWTEPRVCSSMSVRSKVNVEAAVFPILKDSGLTIIVHYYR